MKNRHKNTTTDLMPFFKPPEMMAKICGIGTNTLRRLIDDGELEYIQVGNRKLLTDASLWDYYERKKTPVQTLHSIQALKGIGRL